MPWILRQDPQEAPWLSPTETRDPAHGGKITEGRGMVANFSTSKVLGSW